MAFLKWIAAELIALARFVWRKRAKAYVRIATALIAVGGAVLTVSPVVLTLQWLFSTMTPGNASAPWWLDPTLGMMLILLGVAIFIIFFLQDPDRLQPAKPPPRLELTPGAGWTFEEVAIAIGMKAKRPVTLKDFSPEQKATPMRQQQVGGDTAEELLRNIALLAIGTSLPDYEIRAEDGIIIVRRL